jgi:hypothetical protein
MGLSNVATWEATSGGGRAERAIMGLSHVAAWEPTSQGGKVEGAAMGLSHVTIREPTSRGYRPKGAATAACQMVPAYVRQHRRRMQVAGVLEGDEEGGK